MSVLLLHIFTALRCHRDSAINGNSAINIPDAFSFIPKWIDLKPSRLDGDCSHKLYPIKYSFTYDIIDAIMNVSFLFHNFQMHVTANVIEQN